MCIIQFHAMKGSCADGAEITRRSCGDRAEVMRKWCGRSCGDRAEIVRKRALVPDDASDGEGGERRHGGVPHLAPELFGLLFVHVRNLTGKKGQ